jgi:predicted amidohydrolase YtcJ
MTLDLLITGARVRTFDPTAPWAEAVGIEGDRIAFVGEATDAPSARRTIDGAGRLLTPGIIDSHNHLLLGFDADAVTLEGANDLAEVRRRIAGFADRRPDLAWVCAENAVYSVVEGRRPNAADLEGLTDRPVFVTTYDQHSVWLNRPALRVLGVDAGGDLAWGRPERDPATGEPTGWITDFYTSAMTPAGLAALQRDIPMYSPERRYRKLRSSLRMATSLGITTVVEPQVPLAELELFARARREGALSSRVIAALFHPAGADAAFRRRLRDAVDAVDVGAVGDDAFGDAAADGRFRLGPVKLYADDVIEPHTALMLEDYANRPGVRGRPSYPDRELVDVIGELDRLGLQTHTHATGDGGIRLALDAIEQAARVNGTRDRRHGIVHVECLHPDDLPRFRELGVTAAVQPRHCSPDLVAGTWMANVGEERWDRAWRFRSLLDSGATVAFSSDWQVGEMDPLVGLYSAATRAGLDGAAAWTPDERVGLDRALEAYTVHGARAWHAEHSLGRIAPGMLADLAVWSSDLYALEHDPAALLDEHAEITLVGGQIVHSAGALADVVGTAPDVDPAAHGARAPAAQVHRH